VEAGLQNLKKAEAEKDKLLKCGTSQADRGCSVTIRYVAQASRASAPGAVFAQLVTGFTLASDPTSRVVAVNLVQAEDSVNSLQNFSLEMMMLKYLRPLYPNAHLTLHAGELAPGLVTPENLSFHIRESVTTGAERIGHGSDIMQEINPFDLLKEMARRNVMVEICLSSSDLILGMRGDQHPLAIYIQYGVPGALATDDEGVSRSEISRESPLKNMGLLPAAQDYGPNQPVVCLGSGGAGKMPVHPVSWSELTSVIANNSMPAAACAPRKPKSTALKRVSMNPPDGAKVSPVVLHPKGHRDEALLSVLTGYQCFGICYYQDRRRAHGQRRYLTEN
jgi:hypothetical protein